jgi:hypothetical protein
LVGGWYFFTLLLSSGSNEPDISVKKGGCRGQIYGNLTDVLSSDGDLKCLVYSRFLDSLNGTPSSHKNVPCETDTISILFMLVVD